MTRIALLSQDADLTELGDILRQSDPQVKVFSQGQDGVDSAEIAVCWNPAPGALGQLNNLRLVHSIAAGVDHIDRQHLPATTPVCRVVDPELKRGMAEFVLWGVLHYHRSFDLVQAQQRNRVWSTPSQRPAHEWRIGVMGLGELGAYVAAQLSQLGFHVRGWARSAKELIGVQTWAGEPGFAPFLRGLDCVICLMPLTGATQGIMNSALFDQLNESAVLIHCGRGAHLVADDLLSALDSGQLRGALIDVFDNEPLGKDSFWWNAPNVIVTPHMASSASNRVIADQILENIGRLARNEPLLNRVDVASGY